MSKDGAIISRASSQLLSEINQQAVDLRRPVVRILSTRPGGMGSTMRRIEDRGRRLVPGRQPPLEGTAPVESHLYSCVGCGRTLVSVVRLRGPAHCGRGGDCGTASNGKPRVDHALWVARRRGNAEV